MQEYFEREILNLERELMQLKTGVQKSGGIIETISKTVKIDIPLHIVQSGTEYVRGEATYQIVPETDSIVTVTLDKYYEDVYREWEPQESVRAIYLYKVRLDDGRICVKFSAKGSSYDGGRDTDLDKLKRGESVVVTSYMTVQSTDNFTVGVYNG